MGKCPEWYENWTFCNIGHPKPLSTHFLKSVWFYMFILVKCNATQTHFLKKWVVLHVSFASQYVPLSFAPLSFAHKVGGFTSNRICDVISNKNEASAITTFMPRNAFQANRKEEVLHSGRVGPLSPSGKQERKQWVHSKKEKSFWRALTVFSLACLRERGGPLCLSEELLPSY